MKQFQQHVKPHVLIFRIKLVTHRSVSVFVGQLDATAASRTSGCKHASQKPHLKDRETHHRCQFIQETSLYIHRLWSKASWCSAVWARKWQARRVVVEDGWRVGLGGGGRRGETVLALWLDLLRWRVLWAGPDEGGLEEVTAWVTMGYSCQRELQDTHHHLHGDRDHATCQTTMTTNIQF